MRPRPTHVRAAVADARISGLEAGARAAFGAAAMVGLTITGATVYDTLKPGPIPAAFAPAPASEAFASPTMIAQSSEAPSHVTPVMLPLPAAHLPPVSAPAASSIEPALASGVADVAVLLRLEPASRFGAAANAPHLDDALRARAPQAQDGRLAALADDLAATYQRPAAATRDFALFVASDDEAVSWSLSQASRNYGGLAYQDGSVEIGNIAAGVSLTMEDVRIAAAYVERDLDMRLGRGFESQDQRYAGVVVTLQH